MTDAAAQRPATFRTQQSPLPFDATALPAIANELGAEVREASYRVRGQGVFEVTVPSRTIPGGHLFVVLWPSLSRVDARLYAPGAAVPVVAITRKDVIAVEIYAGIEVTFKRRGGGFLFVTRNGTAASSD